MCHYPRSRCTTFGESFFCTCGIVKTPKSVSRFKRIHSTEYGVTILITVPNPICNEKMVLDTNMEHCQQNMIIIDFLFNDKYI